VVMFMGLCLAPVCIVIEFCPRGSLSDVIQKAASDGAFAQQLPWPKRLSMALDAAKVRSHLAHLASILLIQYLTVWGAEPVMTHQTSWLESTGVCVVQ